jgi:hypothetical protein
MKGEIELVENNREYALVRVKAKDLPKLRIQKEYQQILFESYEKYGFPEKAYDGYHKQGNIVLAFTSDTILMLDCDLKRENELIEFSTEFTKFHKLGSVLIMRTSESYQVDLFGERLGNYCIIFGKILSWMEIKWFVQESYRLAMVNKGFVIIRKFGSITIRVNSKNNEIPSPEPVYYFPNGDNKGVKEFLEDWAWKKNLGLKKVDIEDLTEDKLKEIEKEVKSEVRKCLKK